MTSIQGPLFLAAVAAAAASGAVSRPAAALVSYLFLSISDCLFVSDLLVALALLLAAL